MGASLSWMAVKDTSEEAILRALDLEKSGKFSNNVYDWKLSYMKVKPDWHLILARKDDLLSSHLAWVEKLSAEHDVYVFFVEEHVMYSSACYYSKGGKIWMISHDGSEDLRDFNSEGNLPEFVQKIKEKCLIQGENSSADVDDLFDVAVECSKILVGYSYDQLIDGAAEEYWELSNKNVGWLERLLKR